MPVKSSSSLLANLRDAPSDESVPARRKQLANVLFTFSPTRFNIRSPSATSLRLGGDPVSKVHRLRLPHPVLQTETPRQNHSIHAIKKSAKNTFSYYKDGVKKLGSEARAWWQLKQGNATTWHEHTLKQRVPRDVLRMLPIVVNPLPPPFGLGVPFFASTFPHKFLTRQFWTREQQLEFYRCDHTNRWAKPLVQQHAILQGLGVASSEDAKSLLQNMAVGDERTLRSLSRSHLLALGRSENVRGVVPLRLLSSRRLRKRLLRKSIRLHEEYHLLRNENLDELEEHELWYACLELGLKVDNFDTRQALRDWLHLLKIEGHGDPSLLLLLHAPLLLQWEQLRPENIADLLDDCPVEFE